jgi:signal transduction histidine kinase
MIDTVVRNLLSNAVKFTTSGGSIDLSARVSGDIIEIAVVDTGVGIDENAIEKLFQIDEKYSKPGTAGESGTGLGLILCKELVEKNDGSIRVESEIGRGSTFTFTLPLLHPEAS